MKLRHSYDQRAEVLYISLGAPEKADCHCDDFLYRTSWETGKPCGVTVMDFNDWSDDLIIDKVSQFLGTEKREVENIVKMYKEYNDS